MLFFFVFPVWAEPHATSEILVEAPRILDESIEASRSVSIVTQKEIEVQNQPTVADVLRDIPGVEVTRQGAFGQITSIYIRGARSEDTLVTIDGVEVNDAMAPSRGFDFSSLSPANIERVEVYRGPQSVRFGGGSLGGVINIVTKEGSKPVHGVYSLETGSYESSRGMIGVLGESGKIGYSLSLDGLNTQGFSSADVRDGNSERDGAQMGAASAKLTWVPDTVSKLTATFRYVKTKMDLDVHGGVGGDDPNDTGDSAQMATGIEGQRRFFSEKLKSTLGLYYSELKRSDSNPPDAANTSDSWDRFLSENQKVESNHELTLSDHHLLRMNLQWRGESGGSTSAFNGTPIIVARKEQSDFGQALTYLYESRTWFGDAGVRLDEQTKIGQIPSERFSIGYNFVASQTRVSLTYGTGFKAPSLYQLYSQYGSPSLHWESSETYEWTVEKRWDKSLETSIAFFQNRFKNMIDYDFTTNRYLNIGLARTRGFELQAAADISSDYKAAFNYTYLDALNESTGLSLERRPRHSANFKMNYHHLRWDAFTQIHFEGERPDVNPTNFQRITATGFATIHLGGSYEFARAIKLQARIENLLDRKYQEVAGYGTPGISFYLGATGEIW